MLCSDNSILSRAVFATLLYHDIQDMPLTAVEAWRWMLRSPAGMQAVSLADVEEELLKDTRISFHAGYYALKGREHLVSERISRHITTQKKWRRLRRIAWWLQGIPFLRAAAGGGSLAREYAKRTSDLDLFVVAEDGRMWTARLFLSLFLDLFGFRRRPGGETDNRVCLNHYVTPSGMSFANHSVYAALEYGRLVPLIGSEYIARFRDVNRKKMERHVVRVFTDHTLHRKRVAKSRVLHCIQKGGEMLLFGKTGDAVERMAGWLQRRRMRRGHMPAEFPGRVIVASNHVEFHPESPEALLVGEFRKRAKAAGLTEFASLPDSGLTQNPSFSYTAH